jgi:hypothetical protein
MMRWLGLVFGTLAGFVAFPFGLFAGKRLIHRHGAILRGEVRALNSDPIAAALAGPVIARLSPTAAKGDGRRILGLALRFAQNDHDRSFDLLLATLDSFAKVKEAAASSDPDDFLHNSYRSVMEFRVDGLSESLKLRAVGSEQPFAGADLEARLDAALAAGQARFRLERGDGRTWSPLAEIALQARDGRPAASLSFHPHRPGRGITPIGFLAGARAGIYPFVQAARALRRG